MCFNNTTSLPLLLMQSLGSTGTLSQLLTSPDDSIGAVVERAKSYFLVSSVVGNTITFGYGRDLLGVHDEDPAEEVERDLHQHAAEDDDPEQGANANANGTSSGCGQEQQPDEQTSLLPRSVLRHGAPVIHAGYGDLSYLFDKLPKRMREGVARVCELVSPPAVGAAIGVVLGLAPPLHRLFSEDTNDGGYFNAWLTVSIRNIGELFVALQVVVVGVKLAHSIRQMRRGEESGGVPWLAVLFTLFVRFVFWPVVSVVVVGVLAAKTSLLGDDPVLWFTMMLMPTGPSAMKLASLADVDNASDQDKMAIAKFLTISYILSPLISLAVVASLKTCSEWVPAN